jgi:beta-lactamase regulating signal transducer with metallopeptidase domain
MSTFRMASATPALWMIAKASMLLGLAALLEAASRRRASAAARHVIWTCAITGMLLLPALSLVLPDVPIVFHTAPREVGAATPIADRPDEPGVPATGSISIRPRVAPAPGGPKSVEFPWGTAAVGLYAAGLIGMAIQLAVQLSRVRRLSRRATAVQDSAWTRLLAECAGRMSVARPVRLLRNRACTMPMTFGTRRPSIVLPAVADAWPDDRRRAVLLHELAHIARCDCFTQTLAYAGCAMYWFHPGAWWAARRLRLEGELACDDRVLAAGTQARDYASHLLEIAYAFAGHRAPALAIGMARPRQLEGRILAALDTRRNRTLPRFRVRLAAAAVGVCCLMSIASATPAIVAVGSFTDGSGSASPDSAQQERAVLPLHVKEMPVAESARLIVRTASAALGPDQDEQPGTWEIRSTDTAGTVHLRLMERNSSSGFDMPLAGLEGLTAAQLTGPGGPVQFRLRRDAGTFSFDGVLRNGVGAGTFSFTPDPSFPAELAKRGFARPTASEQYRMARHDVGYAFVDELNRQGYSKPAISELVRAGEHGVAATYLREMGALGYRLGSLDPLITLRDHGITPKYVQELAELGYKGLAAVDLRNARDHGVSAEYVRGMRDAGYGSLAMNDLVEARDHGVSPQFIRELGDAGQHQLPLAEIVRVRDHGVSAEYARGMRQLGYAVPADELVRARDHGVSVEYVHDLAGAGYASLPIDSLIRLRDHGVTPKYAQDLKALGYDRLPVDDVVTLRDHGVTTDAIRAANARAGTRLPIDMLKALAAGGMR